MTERANTNPLSIESFLEILPPEPKPLSTVVEAQEEESEKAPVSHVQDDYEFARNQLRDLIANGTSLFQDASQLASSGQQAEHFEVASNILGQMIAANKELLGLSATHQKVTGAVSKNNGKTITNNNLFVGTTKDLIKAIRQAKEENKEE